MEAEVVSWHVARHVEAPADWVAVALDALIAEKGAVPPSRDGPLTVLAGPVARGVFDGGPRRQVLGRLTLGQWRRSVPVELELTAWSRRRAELALRPRGRVPRGGRATGYFAAAVVALDEMADRLVARLPARLAVPNELERAS